MNTCEYCGKTIADNTALCSGCGNPCVIPGQNQKNPPKELTPNITALLSIAALWTPFLIAAALSGDRQVVRSLLMLPGAFPAHVTHTAGTSQIGCYVASGLISIVVITLAPRQRKILTPVLIVIFLVSCALALVTILGMLV